MLRAACSVFGHKRQELFFKGSIPIPRCWRLHVAATGTDRSENSTSVVSSLSRTLEGYKTGRMIWKECKKELDRAGDNTYYGTVLYNMKMLGGRLVIEPPAMKVKIAEDILELIRQKGMNVNVGIYNILLQIYISNEHTFSPSEFLEKMEKEFVSPNHATINLLFKAYCNRGNMQNASKLLDHMKSLEANIADHEIQAYLITGHARANDMKSAEELLETLKTDDKANIDMPCSSLIKAYAERGNIDAIEKTLDGMHSQPSMCTYLDAINALSQYGHAALTSRIFDRFDSKDWMSSDLHTLACNCLVRGEMEVPRMIIKLLAENENLHYFVVGQYIVTGVTKGMSIPEISSDLKEDVDFKIFPRLYENVIYQLVLLHNVPVVVDQKASRSPPKPGDLAPLPDGVAWVKSILDWYSFVTSEGHKVPVNYYYPLLARCCSDGNIEGFMATWKQILERGFYTKDLLNLYFNKMMNYPGMSPENYIPSSMSKCEAGSEAYTNAAGWGFVLHCSGGRFEEALKLVENFEDGKYFSDNYFLVSNAIKNGFKFPLNHMQLVQLLVGLHDLPNAPNLEFIISSITGEHCRRNEPITNLLDFLSSLEQMGIKAKTGTYLHIVKNFANQNDKDNFLRVYQILMKDRVEEVEEGGYVLLFSAAIKTGNFGVGRNLYQFLPPEIVNKENISCNYLLCLTSHKSIVPQAVDFLNHMLSNNQKPTYHNWSRLIHQALTIHPDLAKELLEKMKSCGMEPKPTMRHKLLELYVQQGLVEDAKREMADIISNKWESRESYYQMMKLWSNKGDVEEVRRLIDEMKTAVGDMDAPNKGSMLVKALLKSGNYDDALATLTEVKSTPPSLYSLNSILVEFNAAGKPLDPVISVLKEMSLSPDLMNSLLFFAHVDSGNEEEAASLIEDIYINRECFHLRMSNPNAPTYLRILKECGYHQRDEGLASQVLGMLGDKNTKQTRNTEISPMKLDSIIKSLQ